MQKLSATLGFMSAAWLFALAAINGQAQAIVAAMGGSGVTRKPLTDELIDALAMDKDGLPNSHLELARAVEAWHGIRA